MKSFIKKIFILIALPHFTTNAMLTYKLEMEAISTNKIERVPGYIVTEAKPYTPGGIVFTYPLDLFTLTPVITLTISAPVHADNIVYTAEVCLESPLGATVMVYKNMAGILTEAGTAEVTIHFLAIGV